MFKPNSPAKPMSAFMFLCMIALCLTAFVGIPPTIAFGRLQAAVQVKNHTDEVLRAADTLMSSMTKTDTARKIESSESINLQLAHLRELTWLPNATVQIDTVTRLIADKYAEMSKNADVSAQRINDFSGPIMDSIRIELAKYIEIEDEALLKATKSFDINLQYLFSTIILATALTFIFGLLTAFFFARLLWQRKKNIGHVKTEQTLVTQESLNERLRDANNVLRESEERLEVTLNSIGDAVIVTDFNACVARLNPIAEELTGWKLEEALGKPVQDIFVIINQETRKKALIPVMTTLEHGVVQGLANHTILIARNGTERSISDSCAPIRDRDNKVIGAILVFRDVTLTYETEQTLHDTATQIKTILNTVADGIITFRADDGLITNSNPAIENLFGYTNEELIGGKFTSLIPELDTDRDEGSLEYYRACEKDRTSGLVREVLGKTKNGRLVPLEITVSEMQLGRQKFFTAILRDISVRRLAEGEMLRANALQNAIFESANFSSIATDSKGVIQIFNVGAEKMLGYTANEVLNKITPANISDPEEIIERAKALSAELNTEITPGFEALVFKASRGIEDIYELTYIRKDGSRFPAVVSVTALRDANEKIIGYLLIGTDNTARKIVEEERENLYHILQEKNDELQIARIIADKANNAKTDFLSSMSHELRTPLSAVLGFAQLIESGTPPPTPSQKKSIEQILKAGWYLLELINEILDLALIDSGKLALSLEPVSLGEVLQECQTMIGLQAKKRSITMSFIELRTKYFVRADRTRLKQILINLLSNAIKYNRENGTVTVDFSLTEPNSIRISVRDTGAGLAPEQIAQLFEPFNRLGQEAIAEEGTGIGLVVSKRLIEMMGGIIGVDSVVNEGSAFWIEMSLIDDTQPDIHMEEIAATFPKSIKNANKNLTLLYVEDNPANLMLVEDLIARRNDIKMISATNGIRGVEIAKATLPDLILMDINLPGMNGIDALKVLRLNPTTAHIPIIALSANAIPRDIERGMEAGFFKYLTKPILIKEFMSALDLAIKGIEEKNAGK